MKNIILRYVFDKKKKANNNTQKGLLQIEARVQGTNKCVYISTGVKLYQHQFSDMNGFTCRNHEMAFVINKKTREIFRQIEEFALSDLCCRLEDIKDWDKEESKAGSFIEFMKKMLSIRNPSYATLEHHTGLIRRMEEFGKIVTFNDLTYENIVLFDSFLRKTVNSSATLNKRHSMLHRYIREAINMEMANKDPYTMFKMPSKKSKEPVYLNEEEIGLLLESTMPNDRLEKVKDLFVFQMFTGMAYIDAQNFNKDSVSMFDGHKTIRSSRSKTDESFIVLFLPEAEKIAEKYEYSLPKISNQRYNDYLKIVQERANITKKLTTHVARHTFATYLLNKGIPIETVSRAMGHSNIKMTEHYARMLGKKVIDDMKKLL